MTYARKLSAADTVLDIRLTARAFHDRVQGAEPSRGVRARSGAVEFKVWRTWPYGSPGLDALPPEAAPWPAFREGWVAQPAACSSVRRWSGGVAPRPARRQGQDGVADFLRGYGARIGLSLESSGAIRLPGRLSLVPDLRRSRSIMPIPQPCTKNFTCVHPSCRPTFLASASRSPR